MDPTEEKEKAIWRQQKHLEIKEDLRNNPTFMKFLERTYPHAREGFLDEYANRKVRWLEWGPKFVEWNEREDMKWINNATKRLKEIQQKKLFDKQCLWRAEKIELKDIKLSIDFDIWEDDIFNCPFIDPVTESEVEMYIQYINSNNFENEQGFLSRWQDYDGIKEAYNSEDAYRNFPDWYDFYNSRTGLSVYMQLPDIRGPKEQYYLKLVIEENKRKNKEAQAEQQLLKEMATELDVGLSSPSHEIDTRPWLNYHAKGWITWFVNTYEDKKTQEVFQKYGGERNYDDYDEYLENDLELLGDADRIIPVEGWFDWKEAIHKAADSYRRQKIIEAMPIAYEQYRINVDLNLGFESPKDPLNIAQLYYDNILRGRELAGEPRNFNF